MFHLAKYSIKLFARSFLKSTLKHSLSSRRSLCSIVNLHDFVEISTTNLNAYIKHLTNEYTTLKNGTQGSKVRLRYLKPLMDILESRNNLEENLHALNDLLEDKDSEIRKLAEEEQDHLKTELKVLDGHLFEALLCTNNLVDDDDDLVLEVNAGVGGQEAMLFANELFQMYCSFAVYKKWQIEVAEYATSEMGGLRHASALISGRAAFRYFKYEAGVHRVQRIPATERSGRIHTSTVSVVAFPQPSEIDVVIHSRDLRIDTKRASGAGGQHVNTTDSAVRVTHLPTGTSVECQTNRSQIKNKEIAMKRLKAILYQAKLDEHEASVEAVKKDQVKSNFRNEKIRTYNFHQDRISDHRISGENIHNLKGFFAGTESLETLIDKLHQSQQIKQLLHNINQIIPKIKS